MWRVFFILFMVANCLWAGTIEMLSCRYNYKTGLIEDYGKMKGEWKTTEKNRVVFEIQLCNLGARGMGVFDNDFFYHHLRSKAKTDLVPFELSKSINPRTRINKTLRLMVDSQDKPFNENDIVFRVEEIVLKDTLENLYSINYYTANKKELLGLFAKDNRSLELDTIDPRGDAKMVIKEYEDMVSYCVFYLYDDKASFTNKDIALSGKNAKIKVPFVYSIKYQNYKDSQIFERVSQNEPFFINVANGQDEYNNRIQKFKADIICELNPKKYENDSLIVDMIFKIRSRQYKEDSEQSAGSDVFHYATLEFGKDDIIQIKIPNFFEPIWRERTGWRVGGKKKDALKLVFKPEVKDQYITIRPIKID